jgi:Uma2 family endonuclease
MHTELLRGIAIEKPPKSPLHRKLVRRLVQALESQVPPELEVWKEDPLTFAESEPEPDVAVIRRSPDGYANAHPSTAELVIEVSVSSLEIDRIKAQIYAEAGVKEYWIVRAEVQTVEVYRQPGPEGYAAIRTVSSPGELKSEALPGVRIELAELFA